MTHIPQITAAEAAHYSLSIRTISGGLAFCITTEEEASPEATRLVHAGRLETSASVHSVYEALQELYFSYEFLSLPYRSVTLYFEPKRAVLVPTALLQEGQDELWLSPTEEAGSTASQRANESLCTLRYTLPDDTKTFVLSWPSDAYQFLRRTLLLIEPKPHFTPILEEQRAKSRATQGRELLLLLRPSGMDLFLIQGGEVEAYNSAPLIAGHSQEVAAGEIIFYTFAFWRHFELDGVTDRLTIAYSEEEQSALRQSLHTIADEACQLLRPYISQITIQGYQSLPHLESEVATAPNA